MTEKTQIDFEVWHPMTERQKVRAYEEGYVEEYRTDVERLTKGAGNRQGFVEVAETQLALGQRVSSKFARRWRSPR